jgi:hypothetical protein
MGTISILPQDAEFMHLEEGEESESDDPTLQIQRFKGLKVGDSVQTDWL